MHRKHRHEVLHRSDITHNSSVNMKLFVTTQMKEQSRVVRSKHKQV
jgi:DNA helicase IV